MTATWSGGYAAQDPYLPTYLSAQAPAEMQAVAALAGVHFGLRREGLTVLDLGCGRGVAALALAAANPSWTVIGIDYMPAHVSEMREIAAEAGLDNLRVLEADIGAVDAAAAERLLPELDCVSLHGLWTWVSDRVRQGILAILGSRLRPGGFALVTYNALPGWSTEIALHRLLRDHVAAGNGPIDDRMTEAIDAARVLHGAGTPGLRDSFFLRRFADAAPGSRIAFARYAVHEFMSDHWRPAFPQDVAADLAAAKLDRVGPANLAGHFAGLTLEPAQREALAGLPRGLDPEFLQDLFAKPGLRQDIFVRGRRPADPATEIARLVLAPRLLPEDGRVALDIPAGQAELPPAVIGAALAALRQRPHSMAELMALPEMARTTPGELLAILVGSHVAAPVWRPAPDAAAVARARRFNEVLLHHLGADAAAMGGDLAIAVPMLGAGVPTPPVEIATLLKLQAAADAGQPPAGIPDLAAGILVADATEAAVAWTEAAVARALVRREACWRVTGLLPGG
jgi:SAM-dependent methyltransferase